MKAQRGSFALGVVVGLLVGLSVALGVALYVTKAPVPFVNKVPQRTPEQDQAEAQRNRNWDPNAPLAGRAGKPLPAASTASGAPVFPPPVAGASTGASGPDASRPARDPAAILAGAPMTAPAPAAPPPAARGSDPFVYFVQAGAYTRAEEAEQQRAKLAMLGLSAKVTEREQHGRVVYRVRVGPYEARQDADAQHNKLQTSGITAQLVRVERP